mgnify:CR=1 FL=1
MSTSAGNYMQLAVYDLLQTLFAPSNPAPVSLHADKLFLRVCGIIKAHFADPILAPSQWWPPKRGFRCAICEAVHAARLYLQPSFHLFGAA